MLQERQWHREGIEVQMTATATNHTPCDVSCGDPRAKLVRAVFEQLNRLGIRYAVPRNWETLPRPTGKDVDILVPAGELYAAAALIRSCADECGFASFILRTDGQGLGVDAVCWPVETSAASMHYVSFDLRSYQSFRIGQVRFPGMNYTVFAERTNRRTIVLGGCEVQILSPLDEWIGLYFQHELKRGAGRGQKAREYADRLKRLLEDRELTSWLERATGSAGREALLSRALSSDRDGSFASALLRSRWGRLSALRWLASQTWAFMIRIRFRWRPLAPIIYFSGPDGAGKTTLTRGVMQRLQECGVPYRAYYSLKILIRAFTKHLAFVKRLGRRRKPPDSTDAPEGPDLLFLTEDTRDRDTGSRLWRFRKKAALIVGVADIWLGWLLVLPVRMWGRVILVETSPYDLFVKYHMPEFPILERVLGSILPRPSVGFLMEADPAKIFKRRAELTRDEIADYYRRFEQILNRSHGQARYKRVRTDASIEHAITTATVEVLATMR
jgi:adenylate kinase